MIYFVDVSFHEGFLFCFSFQGLEASDLYRKAREASEMHWLTTRMGHRVPMVWLRRAKLDEKLREAGLGQTKTSVLKDVLYHTYQ